MGQEGRVKRGKHQCRSAVLVTYLRIAACLEQSRDRSSIAGAECGQQRRIGRRSRLLNEHQQHESSNKRGTLHATLLAHEPLPRIYPRTIDARGE